MPVIFGVRIKKEKMKYILLIGSIFLISCATISKKDCTNTNWKTRGMIDRINGIESSSDSEFLKSCREQGVTPDFKQYNIGLSSVDYNTCSILSVRAKGVVNMPFNFRDCPGPVQGILLREYEEGKELSMKEHEKRSVIPIRSTIRANKF